VCLLSYTSLRTVGQELTRPLLHLMMSPKQVLSLDRSSPTVGGIVLPNSGLLNLVSPSLSLFCTLWALRREA